MDHFHGMEVGAEVELNDGALAIDDHTSIKLENKRDLPLWQHLHYFDDSSSDESLDQQYADSTPSVVKTLEIPSCIPKIRSQVVENKQMEKNKNVLSTTINIQPGAFCINGEQRDDHYFVLSNGYSKNLQEQTFQLAPHFEESGISCTEVMSDSDQLQPSSTEIYTETTLSYEEDLNLGRYTDVRTRYNKTINPLGRNYKCQRCGRQFLRLYNLDNHVCIEKAFRCPQQNSNNVETMNRLEKMCAEAQKELQSLQGQYKKDVVSTQPSFSEAQTWNQELLSESGTVIPATVPCDHHMCDSSSISAEEFQISCNDNGENVASQNMTTLKNIVVVDMTDCSPTFLEANQEQDSPKKVEAIHPQLDQMNSEWTNLNQHLSFQTDENPDDTTNPTPEATNIYKCQECGKMYNSSCSFTNHMHWHQGKKISSIVNAEPSPGGHQSVGTTHHVDTTPLSPKMGDCGKPTQTFTFEYCGKVFNSHVADATHTFWHLKKKGPVTPTQGAKKETGQVSSFTTKKQKSDGACTSAVDVFTCQYCGRVFNKLCAYTNHSRWHVKEKELRNKFNTESRRVLLDEECLKEGDAKNTLSQDNMTFDVDANTGVPDVCLDDGNVQGSCRLVGQLSFDEQHNLPSCEQVAKSEEPCRPPLPMQMEIKQQTIPDVLESVLELVVGTEEVHEILLSKAGLVFRKAENYENDEEEDEDVDEVSGMHSEPKENQISGTKLEPAENNIPGMESELAENQISGTKLEPAENQIPEMELEPTKNHIPGMRLTPEKAQISGRQLEPEKKIYSPQILPCKIAAQLLCRPRPPHRCRDCGIRFHQIWRLKQHRLKGFGKTCTLKKHQCDCGRTPVGSLHFLLHQLQHLSDTTFTCAVCNKSLCGYRQLQAHSLVHPLVSQFQCKCGTRFTKLPRYLWHSLKNKAKPKPKLQMEGCTEPSF